METKRIKKSLSIFLCMCLIFTFNVYATQETHNPNIYVERVFCSSDETSVDIQISINNNPGIASIRLKLDYNTTNLELVSIINGSVFPDSKVIHNDDINYFGGILYWNDTGSRNNNTNNGVLATLRFNIKDCCTVGENDISVSYANGPSSIINLDLNPVAFDFYNGFVYILNANNYTIIYPQYNSNGKMVGIFMYGSIGGKAYLKNPTDLMDLNKMLVVSSDFRPIVF